MFTRYGNINIPKNYSGNRFRREEVYETETKAHRPSQSTYSTGGTKTTISPAFQEEIAKKREQYSTDDKYAQTSDSLVFPLTPYTRPTTDTDNTVQAVVGDDIHVKINGESDVTEVDITPEYKTTIEDTLTYDDFTEDDATIDKTTVDATVGDGVRSEISEVKEASLLTDKLSVSKLIKEIMDSGIGKIFSKSNREDLLIVALILLVSLNGEGNSDIILFLAILLLF